MTKVPADLLPPHEDRRMEAVHRYNVLDTPPDGAFDRITALAARLFDVPISTVTIVDHDRIWFKSAYGIEVDQIDRDPGLCASAILQADPYIVQNATDDVRCLENPLVRGELGLRFYAAAPLRTADGYNLGTLNIIDVEPRELTEDQVATLEDLAAIVVDELELRLAAARAVELEATREAARLRDAIVAGISHEMRTPLALLRGISDLVDNTAIREPEEEGLHAMLRRQVRHLDWLVGQFLDYTRLENDREVPVSPEPINVIELLEEAAEIFVDRVEVTLETGEAVPAAFADRDRTQQILIELLNNAVRFAGSDTPITVAVFAGRDNTVRVAVIDHGPGIPEPQQGRIFDRFVRGEGSTGSGVGLYVSRRVAETQGGRIEVDSTPGRGSCFTLVLPATDRPNDG